ncbi:hypothetical protein BaRGS_00006108 [Batillaria attramentaria]|uniref:Uncharacterized protein n=1 Tax=Batillaria attramentaria TaxID=370345 RepID=A0ABD0LTT4_9CAEN
MPEGQLFLAMSFQSQCRMDTPHLTPRFHKSSGRWGARGTQLFPTLKFQQFLVSLRRRLKDAKGTNSSQNFVIPYNHVMSRRIQSQQQQKIKFTKITIAPTIGSGTQPIPVPAVSDITKDAKGTNSSPNFFIPYNHASAD